MIIPTSMLDSCIVTYIHQSSTNHCFEHWRGNFDCPTRVCAEMAATPHPKPAKQVPNVAKAMVFAKFKCSKVFPKHHTFLLLTMLPLKKNNRKIVVIWCLSWSDPHAGQSLHHQIEPKHCSWNCIQTATKHENHSQPMLRIVSNNFRSNSH